MPHYHGLKTLASWYHYSTQHNSCTFFFGQFRLIHLTNEYLFWYFSGWARVSAQSLKKQASRHTFCMHEDTLLLSRIRPAASSMSDAASSDSKIRHLPFVPLCKKRKKCVYLPKISRYYFSVWWKTNVIPVSSDVRRKDATVDKDYRYSVTWKRPCPNLVMPKRHRKKLLSTVPMFERYANNGIKLELPQHYLPSELF